MAKDPAMLWYWSDWNSGTVTFSRHLKGCYMDLLHAQFNNGHLSIEEVKTVLGSDFGSSWPTIQKKFKTDPDGLYFNERLELEKQKRKQFTEGRRNNLKGHKDNQVKPHMASHMEDVNENTNTNLPLKSEDFAHTLESFKKAIGEAYIETMAMNHKGKDVEAAISQAHGHYLADPSKYATGGDLKKLLNTWLANTTVKQLKKPSFNLSEI